MSAFVIHLLIDSISPTVPETYAAAYEVPELLRYQFDAAEMATSYPGAERSTAKLC